MRSPGREPIGRADHLVLVSVDALRPEFYRDERWPAPSLQQLAWEGVAAGAVRSVFPALTYPAHTTIVTGELPDRHGIWHNRPFRPEGPNRDWYWSASAIRTATPWDAVRAAGGTSAAVAWPVTVGAPIDWNVPDVWIPGSEEDTLEPVRRATRPRGLFEELEREATGVLRPEEFRLGSLARDGHAERMAAYLFERRRPTLLLLHLTRIDHLQHEHGRGNPRLRRAVGAADRAIGEVLEAVGRSGLRDRTAILVVGDHGTAELHAEIRPNVWLAEAGLRGARLTRGSWRATFHGDVGAMFLRLRDSSDPEAIRIVRRRLNRRGRRVGPLFRIIERAELDALGAAPGCAFALAAVPGVVFSEAAVGPVLAPAVGGGHGYHPDEPEMVTGFVGAGPGLRRGASVPLLPLQNLAPLAAALLGLDLPVPDGVLLPGLLTR